MLHTPDDAAAQETRERTGKASKVLERTEWHEPRRQIWAQWQPHVRILVGLPTWHDFLLAHCKEQSFVQSWQEIHPGAAQIPIIPGPFHEKGRG